MTYADLKQTKQRANTEDTKSESDEKLNSYMTEADGYINNQISLHAVTPVANPDSELVTRGSSLAAALFNYWQAPAKDRTIEAVEYFEQKIQDHILAVYGKKNPTGLSGSSFAKTNSSVTGMEA